MKKLTTKEFMIPFVTILSIGVLINAILLPLVTYNGAQKYRDIIYGLAGYNTNKTNELTLFKVMLLVTSVLIIVFTRFIKPKKDIEVLEDKCNSYILYCCIGLNLGYYLIRGTFNGKIVAASIFFMITMVVYANKTKFILLLGICSYYAVTAYISLTIFLTQYTENVFWKRINQAEIFILTIIVVTAVIVAWNKFGDLFLKRAILIEQIIIPLNFLIYLKTLYTYGEEVYNIFQHQLYEWIILLVCACGVLLAFRHFKKVNIKSDWGKLISISTVITIFSMNSYIAPVSIVPSDFWHHGEQVTAWHQISDLGQGLYTEFCPSSGAYSIPIGILIKMFGGNATAYATAYSFIAMCVAIIVAIICIKFADEKIALLLAISTGTLVYNRGILILPYLLLLTMPKLIENRSAWLKTWIIFSMLCGIYYPAVGIALLVATIPFGIFQLIKFFHTDEWKQKRKSVIFWITWALTLICVGVNAKMLINLALYVLSLAGQSVEADSFTLLVYTAPPSYFMPFLSEGIRYVVYLFARILLAGIVVVLPASLFFVLRRTKGNEFWGSPMSMALSSSAIFLLLYQSFSLLRADKGCLLSRTGAGVLAISSYLLIAFYYYGKGYMTNKLNYILSSILFVVSVTSFAYCGFNNFPQVDYGIPTGGIFDDVARLVPVYNIDAGSYIYTPNEGEAVEEWIGEGFISTQNYNSVTANKQFIEQYGLQDEYFVNLARFSFFLLDVKAAYVDSTNILQSKTAQDRMIDSIKEEMPIFTSFSTAGDYELLKWIQENNYKQLSNGWYVSPQTIQKHGMEALVASNTIYTRYSDYGRNANAFGKSFRSLEKTFEKKKDFSNNCSVSVISGLEEKNDSYEVIDSSNVCLQINFPEEIDGTEYDYLYLDLNTNLEFHKMYEGRLDQKIQTYYAWNTKLDENVVTLYWQNADGSYSDECTCSMSLQTGELLIPIGYNSSWKNAVHNQIQIRLSGNFQSGMEINPQAVCVLGR